MRKHITFFSQRKDIMKNKLFKKNRISTFIVFLLILGLLGCGSSDSGGGSGEGSGKIEERYTADFNGHTYQLIDVDTTWEEEKCISKKSPVRSPH